MKNGFGGITWALVARTGLCTTAWAGGTVEPPSPGSGFDAAPFGFPLEEQGNAWGVAWADPRKVRRVVVEFTEGIDVPSARSREGMDPPAPFDRRGGRNRRPLLTSTVR